MLSSDNRYSRGTQREMIIYDNNQLNVVYGGENSLNPKYVIHLAKTLYNKDGNCFFKFVDIFDKYNDAIIIKRELKNLSPIDKVDYETLILLSKFYINFIYNYDSCEKNNYDYDIIPIDNRLKGTLSNKEFIYEIRTAIMHGRYTYQNDIFNFWNYSKNDNEIKTFDLTISYDEFVDIIIANENDFYANMKYSPEELINSRKTL